MTPTKNPSYSASTHDVWTRMHAAALQAVENFPRTAELIKAATLANPTMAEGLSHVLARQHLDQYMSSHQLANLFLSVFHEAPHIIDTAAADLNAVTSRDPAATDALMPFLYFKGFHALQTYRAAHWLWEQGDYGAALFLQNRSSVLYAVDIHPAARIGQGIMLDHATGLVIGETAVVEDNVSMLHEVTLGGTGKERGDRHPKIREGVMIGAGAKILGNLEIGKGASIAAGSVVLQNVPPHATVAGVPAKIIGHAKFETPAFEMNQNVVSESEAP